MYFADSRSDLPNLSAAHFLPNSGILTFQFVVAFEFSVERRNAP